MGLNDVTRTLVDRGWVAADRAEEAEDSLLRAPVATEEDLVYEPPGKVIAGRYEIQRALAHGGMGSVYEAIQLGLGRRVAVKAVAEEDEELIERFRREAQALADVSHPGIVEVYDFIPVSEQTEGRCYLVMTFIEGHDLEGYLSAQPERRLSPAEAVALLRPVVSAIVELHANGILHRDLKPANIVRFVRADGQASAKLLDFGIARRAVDEGLTATGSVLGTPAYIAPEAMFGRTQTPKSDVYSLGATLFELLTGAPPFGDGAPVEIIKRLVAHVIELPTEVKGTPLGDLVEQMLEMEPDKRPTALDVASTLDQLHHAGFWTEPTETGASPDPSNPPGLGASSAGVPPATEPQAPALEPSSTPAATAPAPASEAPASYSYASSAPAAGEGDADPLSRVGDRTDPALPLATRPQPGPRPWRGLLGVLAAAVVVLLGGVAATTWLYLCERGRADRAAAARGSPAPAAARTTDSPGSRGAEGNRARPPASRARGGQGNETASPSRRPPAAARRGAEAMSDAPPSGAGADSPRASADRVSADRASADRASADRPAADRASADRASADRASADRPAADDASADPRVQKLMRECRSATDARRLYARARHASRERDKQGFARAAFRALLLAGCSPQGLKRYSARYLATLLIRAGRCEEARSVWKVFRSLSPARGGRKPAFPACRPR